MSGYVFRGEPERRAFGALPEGDYTYVVSECDEPYKKDNGNWVLAVRLSIQPSGQTVFANPWTGTDRNGDLRDGIAEFLVSCNRAPKPGTEPVWAKVVGARGRVRLKTEIAQMGSLAGKEVNKVAWFHAPKQVEQTAEAPRQSYSQEEYNQARRQQEAKSAGRDDVEPTDIPF